MKCLNSNLFLYLKNVFVLPAPDVGYLNFKTYGKSSRTTFYSETNKYAEDMSSCAWIFLVFFSSMILLLLVVPINCLLCQRYGTGHCAKYSRQYFVAFFLVICTCIFHAAVQSIDSEEGRCSYERRGIGRM